MTNTSKSTRSLRRSPPRSPRQSGRPPKGPHRTANATFRFKWWWLLLLLLMVPLGTYVSNLDVAVRERFEGKRWELPARVYARRLELYSGMPVSLPRVIQELKEIRYREVPQLFEPGQYVINGNQLIINTRPFVGDKINKPRQIWVSFQGNNIEAIGESTADKTNSRLGIVSLEPKLIGKIYPSHNEDRILVSLKEVPELLIQGLIAVEDRSFYRHMGISIRGLLRASIENFKANKRIQGGSTITQQLVKNMFLNAERTLDRKIKEALMSVLLEWHYTKEDILEAYLNQVFLGQDGDRAIHGIGTAAWFYFGRPVEELKTPEIALLIGLIRAASSYNPRKNYEEAINRRNVVLDVMANQGVISTKEAAFSKMAPLGVTSKPLDSDSPYPAFLELVQRQLRQDYKTEDLRSKGLIVLTTLDPWLQEKAENAMINGLRKLGRGRGKLQGAMVVTRSSNGEVVAFVNGKDGDFAGFNRPLNAHRQIGSLVKVAVYLTALENSDKYSLTTTLADMPINVQGWAPKNYDGRPHGLVPLYQALANSYNLATVRLGMRLGLNEVRKTMKRMGVDRDFKVVPSTLLGTVELTPFEVAQMYQTIASNGFYNPLRSIETVMNHEGKPLQRYSLSPEQRFGAGPIFLLTYAMQHAFRAGTGRRVGQTFPSDMIIAGKTGTGSDFKDSWFAGFGSELLAVSWLGRDDNKPIGLSGGEGALVVWGDFMHSVNPKCLPPIEPNEIQWHNVNDVVRIPFLARGGRALNSTLAEGRHDKDDLLMN